MAEVEMLGFERLVDCRFGRMEKQHKWMLGRKTVQRSNVQKAVKGQCQAFHRLAWTNVLSSHTVSWTLPLNHSSISSIIFFFHSNFTSLFFSWQSPELSITTYLDLDPPKLRSHEFSFLRHTPLSHTSRSKFHLWTSQLF